MRIYSRLIALCFGILLFVIRAQATESVFMRLGAMTGGYDHSDATGVSADGSVVVGDLNKMSGGEAFRWTRATGMIGLGGLPGGGGSSNAIGVSADGSVVVGRCSLASGLYKAFRWTQTTGMVGLSFPGARTARPMISADGQTIILNVSEISDKKFKEYPVICYGLYGGETLEALLTHKYGIDMTGWSLQKVTGMSADGMIMIGNGTNPTGNIEAWIIDLKSKELPPPPGLKITR